MAEKQLSIEQAFDELEAIIKDMENPELSLEDSFTKYNKGLELIKSCNASIDKIEQQLTILEESNQ